MKLGDIIQRITNLSPDKEYDFSVTEKQATMEPDSVTIQQPTPEKTTIEQPGQESSTAEPSADSVKIAQLEAQIELLKQTNQALLAKTPVEESTQSVEQMIHNLIMPKGKEN